MHFSFVHSFCSLATGMIAMVRQENQHNSFLGVNQGCVTGLTPKLLPVAKHYL